MLRHHCCLRAHITIDELIHQSIIIYSHKTSKIIFVNLQAGKLFALLNETDSRDDNKLYYKI